MSIANHMTFFEMVEMTCYTHFSIPPDNKDNLKLKAAVLVATTLTAGLTVLPGSIQEAQAENPCNIDTLNIEAEEVGNNCEFYGNTEIDSSSELPCIGPICEVRPLPPGLIEIR